MNHPLSDDPKKHAPPENMNLPQNTYDDPVLGKLYNFIPSSMNPDNNIHFEERSNPLSSKGD